MDDWGWDQLHPWLEQRNALPVGRLFCIIDGPTQGRPWTASAVRTQLRRLLANAAMRGCRCAQRVNTHAALVVALPPIAAVVPSAERAKFESWSRSP
jgi:hypothetical protein